MLSYIFDTSFIVSLLDIDDINHNKALEIISKIDKNIENKFYINEIILNETYTILNYKKWFNFIEKVESFLEQIGIINLSWNNKEYILFFKIINWKISVADSSVLYDSYKHNLKILTFDKEMIKLSKQNCVI